MAWTWQPHHDAMTVVSGIEVCNSLVERSFGQWVQRRQVFAGLSCSQANQPRDSCRESAIGMRPGRMQATMGLSIANGQLSGCCHDSRSHATTRGCNSLWQLLVWLKLRCDGTLVVEAGTSRAAFGWDCALVAWCRSGANQWAVEGCGAPCCARSWWERATEDGCGQRGG